jgi:biotin-(acetyl-CoA carboxylase) ligase
VVGRGRQKRSWASSASTRSEFELVCPPLVRRRKPSQVRRPPPSLCGCDDPL